MNIRLASPVKTGGFLTLFFSLAVLFYYYHSTLLHPGRHVFASPSDGLKNYYTVGYHARYDSSSFHFGGMNYPYGNHISFVDGQPALSWFIGLIGAGKYSVIIMNLLMLLSFPVAACVYYLLFIRYRVPPWWAWLGAVALAFMTQQTFRLPGHYSLSYIFVVPLGWYLHLRGDDGKGYGWPVIFGIYVFLLAAIHPYLTAMIAGFSFIVLLYKTFFKPKRNLLRLLIQVVVPVTGFKLLTSFTDTHAARLDQADGFFEYHGNWASVFIPTMTNKASYLNRWFDTYSYSWEGENYIGTATYLLFLIALGVWAGRKAPGWRTLGKQEMLPYLLAAVVLLLLSFCIPFKWPSFQWMMPYIGPLGQLRALGRFSWVFYTVITVAISVFYIAQVRQSRYYKTFFAIYLLGVGMYFYESSAYHHFVVKAITTHANVFDPEQLDQDARATMEAIGKEDPSALLLLPFNHFSSGCFGMLGNDTAFADAMVFSYHLGLPLMNTSASRLSLIEAENFVELFSPPFLPKKILRDMGEGKKILLLHDPLQDIGQGERQLMSQSEWIGKRGKYDLYVLRPDQLKRQELSNKIVENANKAEVELAGGWKAADPAAESWLYYQDFDERQAEFVFAGKGSWEGVRSRFQRLAAIPVDSFPSRNMVASFWYNVMQKECHALFAVVEYTDTLGKGHQWIATAGSAQLRQIEGEWGLVEMAFDVPGKAGTISIYLDSEMDILGRTMPLWVDELLIRPSGLDVFRKVSHRGEERMSYNNYLLPSGSGTPAENVN